MLRGSRPEGCRYAACSNGGGLVVGGAAEELGHPLQNNQAATSNFARSGIDRMLGSAALSLPLPASADYSYVSGGVDYLRGKLARNA